MEGEAVHAIKDLALDSAAKVVEIGDRSLSTRPLHLIPLAERRRQEKVDAIELSSLTGVADYLAVQKDGLAPETHFIHIEGPTSLRVVGSLLDQGETNQRHTFVTAKVPVEPFPWGQAMDTETLIVGLQARFSPTPDRDRLLKIIGTIVHEESLKVEDDGVTQRATAKAGIQRREDVVVENPFMLAPFRTFQEIKPPTSPFILRLKKGPSAFTASLSEADGGAWKISAVGRIAEWIKGQDTGFSIIE